MTLGLRDNNSFGENDNNVLLNVPETLVSNLQSDNGTTLQSYNKTDDRKLVQPSNNLDIFRSPQSTINDVIVDRLDSFNLQKYYANNSNFCLSDKKFISKLS